MPLTFKRARPWSKSHHTPLVSVKLCPFRQGPSCRLGYTIRFDDIVPAAWTGVGVFDCPRSSPLKNALISPSDLKSCGHSNRPNARHCSISATLASRTSEAKSASALARAFQSYEVRGTGGYFTR
jgi:hypothetical protein